MLKSRGPEKKPCVATRHKHSLCHKLGRDASKCVAGEKSRLPSSTLHEPDIRSGRHICLGDIGRQQYSHPAHTDLGLQELDGKGVRVTYVPSGCAKLNGIVWPNLEITFHRGNDHTTPAQNLKRQLNLEKKRHPREGITSLLQIAITLIDPLARLAVRHSPRHSQMSGLAGRRGSALTGRLGKGSFAGHRSARAGAHSCLWLTNVILDGENFVVS
jgi:hypothetical protein